MGVGDTLIDAKPHGQPVGACGTTMGAFFIAASAVGAVVFEAARRGWSFANAFEAWWIDPAVATVSFACAIAVYDRRERTIGLQSREFMAAGSQMGLVAAGVVYWAGVLAWVCVVPRPGGQAGLPNGIPTRAGEFLYLAAEVIIGVLSYDFVFFLIHWSMHEVEALRGVHHLHHTMRKELRARDVLLHSPVDGALQVLVNILVQRHTPWGAVKSRAARAIHNVVVTWMLTESHTASPSPRVARRWFVGVRRHRAHHIVDSPYFQQFFGYLDDARILISGKGNLLAQATQQKLELS
mmetsp:Transcript_31584/g.87100  ORF Transcript_31584/g.87100 Transcript_31584/m.87100 type:complete len:295 (-) Transcript_31584:70-954(-)